MTRGKKEAVYSKHASMQDGPQPFSGHRWMQIQSRARVVKCWCRAPSGTNVGPVDSTTASASICGKKRKPCAVRNASDSYWTCRTEIYQGFTVPIKQRQGLAAGLQGKIGMQARPPPAHDPSRSREIDAFPATSRRGSAIESVFSGRRSGTAPPNQPSCCTRGRVQLSHQSALGGPAHWHCWRP